jgi:DNA-binding response OmpR family regulator
MLTARDEEIDRIVGLEMGADDYVVKPFNPRELSARIRAVLRRGSTGQSGIGASDPSIDPEPPASSLAFDDRRRRASLHGSPLDLRPREYDLLRFLWNNRGQVFTRDTLLDRVWGVDSFIGARTVDVHIRRIRRKLANIAPQEEIVLTEWGVGYSVAEDA